MATEKVGGLALADSIQEEIVRWLTQPAFESERVALERTVSAAASGDPAALAELEDAFSGPLPIGTGGRRGPCGPGTNRINVPLMRETAYGLALAMEANDDVRKVAVVYDTRKTSRQYAHLVAAQLAAAGMKVLLLDAPRPTPQLSYLVRHHGCGAGIVISASHNPAGDNGIKIYGPDGAQVLGERDRSLMEAILRVGARPSSIPPLERADAGSIEELDVAVSDADYHRHVAAQAAVGSLEDAALRVVYTPLHGVGHTAVVPVLEARGARVEVVEAQLPDDGAFGTVDSANPENPEALALAEALAEKSDADLVIASDPDADRLGALVRHRGEMRFVDGNRLGVLMLDHVLTELDPVPADGIVITTMVTSPLLATLCGAAGIEVVDDLLVGFKHHAGVMRETEGRPLVFACEESHGYNRGNDVRDKDGAVGALLLAECAAVEKRRGRTLIDRLTAIWDRHGYHREKTVSLWAHGSKGKLAISRVMEVWRDEAPSEVAALRLAESVDRRASRSTGSPTRDLPGNVLSFELSGSDLACRLVVRPSGTEPKLKLYVMARGSAATGSRAAQSVDALIEAVISDAEAKARAIMAPVLEP